MDWHSFSPRSHRVLLPLAIFASLALLWVEQGKRVVQSPWFEEKLRAAEVAYEGSTVLKELRLERGVFVDTVNDPAETALIGQEYTQITTDRGNLEAKITSTNPNFAAVVVDMIHSLGLKSGDCVAVAATGSFPALNLSALAALETVGLRPALITSVGASNYGATDPYYTWLDMERDLVARGVLETRSITASLGGGNDSGRGLAPRGRELLRSAIQRNEIPLLEVERLEDSIRQRVELFRQACLPQPVAAYVNIGGGMASLGHSLNGELIPAGAYDRLPQRNYPARGALLRFASEGVPVIQLTNVRTLRDRYGLGTVQDSLPLPGQGEIFGKVRYSMVRTLVATLVLLALLIGLYLWDQSIHRLGSSDPEGLQNESP
ncbi:MAG: poly-gamma-glutamate system protein [Acidobacteriota bacterium]